MKMRALLIDNYDSYTFNLYQLLAQVGGEEPLVVQNDDFDSDWAKLCASLIPGVDFDCVVISPGPGSPEVSKDVGLSEGAMRDCCVPVFGVCLGHQLLGFCHGAKVSRAKEPMHGRLSPVLHNPSENERETDMFYKIPSPFSVVRYHSLLVEEDSLPKHVKVTARTDCGVLMGLKVQWEQEDKITWGVQFHPESICTEFGRQLMENFFRATRESQKGKSRATAMGSKLKKMLGDVGLKNNEEKSSEPRCSSSEKAVKTVVCVTRVDSLASLDLSDCPTETLFETLFQECDESTNCGGRFWLDSATRSASMLRQEGDPTEPCSRFSYLGDARGPLAHLVETFVDPSERAFRSHSESQTKPPKATLRVSTWDDELQEWVEKKQKEDHITSETAKDDVFAFLNSTLSTLRDNSYFTHYSASEDCEDIAAEKKHDEYRPLSEWNLPFPFAGGYVGYLGYGLRRLCGVKSTGVQSEADKKPIEQKQNKGTKQTAAAAAAYGEEKGEVENFVKTQACGGDRYVPDSTFVFADRFLAWDHDAQVCYLVALTDQNRPEVEATQKLWMRKTREAVEKISKTLACSDTKECAENLPSTGRVVSSPSHDTPLIPNASDEEYKEMIEKCIELIRAGETYEVCLTKQIAAKCQGLREQSLKIYQHLRSSNPAPYAAFLEVKNAKAIVQGRFERCCDFAVCCSSPERFLRVDSKGLIESKPIKGTIRRGVTLEEDMELAERLRTSVKDRAENLMIVDLVRNDIGRVCEIGSVSVPRLMAIESFASVHQLVTTVTGQLERGHSTLEAIRAAFPGGSMTGAPKLRTMQIIDEIEREERGVYSGALGFLSITGASDLNIVIRTAVVTPGGVSVGTGGAIVVLSDPQEEVDETHLKAAKLQSTFARFLQQ